jgi:hypothetical protein
MLTITKFTHNSSRRKVTTLATLEAVTLSEEEVLRIHYALVEEFAKSNNSLDPPGVKSHNLLGAAISRQHSGLGFIGPGSEPVYRTINVIRFHLFQVC